MPASSDEMRFFIFLYLCPFDRKEGVFYSFIRRIAIAERGQYGKGGVNKKCKVFMRVDERLFYIF